MEKAAPVSIGELVAEKYRVDRVIGAGGMGVVVAATHVALDQKVAIKFLLADHAREPDVVARFQREGRALAKIQSEHVARVIDVGTLASGETFLVLEYLEGRDLAAVIHERGPIAPGEAAQWILEAAEAIGEAHQAGIIHRDLKPANLFLVRRKSGRSMIKVLDFGIAKSLAADADLTATRDVLGSPLYMAPEQLQASRDVDSRTDIWALGVILYELLSGRPPFNADSIGALVNAILNSAPAAMANVPESLEAVVLRCLSKLREDRFPSIDALCVALAPFAVIRRTTAPPTAAELADTEAVPRPPAVPLEAQSGRATAWGTTKPEEKKRRPGAFFVGALGLIAAVVVGKLLYPSSPPAAPVAPAQTVATPASTAPPEPKPTASEVAPVVDPPASVRPIATARPVPSVSPASSASGSAEPASTVQPPPRIPIK